MIRSAGISVRKFRAADREAVRKISCHTAFLDKAHEALFRDEKILADVLTLYYTDHEPASCFVAVEHDKVIGYLIGSKNVKKMYNVFIKKILPELIIESLQKKIIFTMSNLRFFVRILASFLKGEFFVPDYSSKYPATLHINLEAHYRGRKVGTCLIEHYLVFLREEGMRGLHLGTMSEGAKCFFLKLGFSLLHSSKRTYLRCYLKQDIPYYVFGKSLPQERIC